jgi:hypothetical protein
MEVRRTLRDRGGELAFQKLADTGRMSADL